MKYPGTGNGKRVIIVLTNQRALPIVDNKDSDFDALDRPGNLLPGIGLIPSLGSLVGIQARQFEESTALRLNLIDCRQGDASHVLTDCE
jgi:hypothetical protein